MIPHTEPPDNIVVLAIRPAPRGNLRGFADIRIGKLTIKDLRIIQQPSQRPWVLPSQQEWLTPDGQRHYAPLLEFVGGLKAVAKSMVLDASRWEVRHG